MRKKRKNKAFYKVVAEAIIEGSPFDVCGNDGGWTKVQELLTLFMLRELKDKDRYEIWNEYLARVEGVFYAARSYINDNPDNLPQFNSIHCYLFVPEGRRNNEFLSAKPGYRSAKLRNTDRLVRRMEVVVCSAMAEIAKADPARLPESRAKAMKILTGSTE